MGVTDVNVVNLPSIPDYSQMYQMQTTLLGLIIGLLIVICFAKGWRN